MNRGGPLGNPVHVMGMLSSRKLSGPTGKGIRWKKHFWVANMIEKRLDYFVNDQSLIRKGSINVRDVVSTSIGGDRSDKFYSLLVSCRGGFGREFRMRTSTERDQWYKAVLEMIDSLRTVDQVSSLMSAVRQRLREMSSDSGIAVESNVASLGEMPLDVHNAYIEALDSGARLLRKLVASLRNTGPVTDVLTRLNLVILPGDRPWPALTELATESTQYDPIARALTLQIFITKDPMGNWDVAHVDHAAALNLLNSSLYRDPRYEGWLTIDRRAAEERERIAALLGLDTFTVSLQWSPSLSQDDESVRNYFEKYITSTLLHDVYLVFQAVCQADSSTRGFRPSGLLSDTSVDLSTAACIRRCVTGISIIISHSHVRDHIPPDVNLTDSRWEDPYYQPAFAVTSQIRREVSNGTGTTPLDRGGTNRSPIEEEAMAALSPTELRKIKNQIMDVITLGRIAATCECIVTTLSSALNLVEGVDISWERLTSVLLGLAIPLDEATIPTILIHCFKPYVDRVHNLVLQLKGADLYETFLRCVGSFKLGFQSISDHPIAVPTVYLGAFYETMIFCPANVQAAAVAAVTEVPPIEIEELAGVSVVFSTAFLGSWFRGYFAHPANVVPLPTRGQDDHDGGAGGGGDYGDDSDSDEEANFGEQVAVERRDETKVLQREDVANLVYLQQGEKVELKVSADCILKATDALEAIWKDVSMKPHDMRRVLIHTLTRLRNLFTDAEERGISVKDRETVIDILKESCEFSESDELVDAALSKTLSPAPFQAGAAVSIQVLLPNEIKLAVRSRRSILLVGLANTGKTMITDTLRHMPSTVVPLPTVGRTVTVVAYREWIMQVNEIGGRHDFRTNWKHYLQLCEDLRGVIFVVDSAQRSQVSDATAYFHALMKHPKLRDRPVLVLANNSGAPKALSAQVLKDAFDLGSRPGCCLSQCDITHPGARSAMDEGLCRGLDWLCSRLRELSDPNSVPAVPKSVVATPTYVQSTD